MASKHRIFTTAFSRVYPMYLQKVERKGRTKAELDQVICWLTGYTEPDLQRQIERLLHRLVVVVRQAEDEIADHANARRANAC